jgi:hypothetical protein
MMRIGIVQKDTRDRFDLRKKRVAASCVPRRLWTTGSWTTLTPRGLLAYRVAAPVVHPQRAAQGRMQSRGAGAYRDFLRMIPRHYADN